MKKALFVASLVMLAAAGCTTQTSQQAKPEVMGTDDVDTLVNELHTKADLEANFEQQTVDDLVNKDQTTINNYTEVTNEK